MRGIRGTDSESDHLLLIISEVVGRRKAKTWTTSRGQMAVNGVGGGPRVAVGCCVRLWGSTLADSPLHSSSAEVEVTTCELETPQRSILPIQPLQRHSNSLS